jgi:GH43 family beta-xylosidase
MYVLESKTDDPQGEYEFLGKITSPDDHWAIDGTVLPIRGRLYFIWSGWETDGEVAQNLYIANMVTPWAIAGERALLSEPTYPWEHSCHPPINEGPEVLQYQGRTFIIYSGASALTDKYCLGQLTLVGDDPMQASSWQKHPKPVFKSTRTIFAPGHASFTQSLFGKWLIFYHTARRSGSGFDRQVRVAGFSWNRDGTPNFGRPSKFLPFGLDGRT